MLLILQIIGGIVVTVIAIIVSVILYFRFKFGKYLDMDVKQEPLVIHLTEDVAPDWQAKKHVKADLAELEKLGFTKGRAYTIHELDEYVLQAFFKPPVVAVLYWNDIAGCWTDMVIEKTNGEEYTYSNAPMGGGMKQRPGVKKYFKKEYSIKQLYDDVSSQAGQEKSEYIKVDNSNFRQYFENAYKKDMAWKNRKGGISYEEFLKLSDDAPFSTKDKDIVDAFIETKEGELYQWEEAVLEEYRKRKKIDEEHFYEMEHRLIIVPFTTDARAYFNYLESSGFMNEDQAEKLGKVYAKEKDMFSLFEKINSLLSPALRAEFMEEFSFPLKIKVFQLSKDMKSSC